MRIKASIDPKSIASLNQKVKRVQDNIYRTKIRIGEEEVTRTKQRLVTSKTDPNGIPWQPWSVRTLRQRTRENKVARGLLDRTGVLIRSIKSKVSGNFVIVYSNTLYSLWLQRGTTRMPQRQFLGWGNNVKKNIKKLLIEGIKK